MRDALEEFPLPPRFFNPVDYIRSQAGPKQRDGAHKSNAEPRAGILCKVKDAKLLVQAIGTEKQKATKGRKRYAVAWCEFEKLKKSLGNLREHIFFQSTKLDHRITEYVGGRAAEVEKVSWSKDTVWVDKARTAGFKGVREEVWHFHIGGYQVCEKWLKDRGPKKGKCGRTLTKSDIAHYQKIVLALSETIRLMKGIGKIVEEHGGWPLKWKITSSPIIRWRGKNW